MNELKSKIFILLTLILSAFLITLLFIFNMSIYDKEYNDVVSKIKILQTFNDRFKGKNPLVVENEVYEVVFSRNNKIEKIISYSTNGLSNDEIIELINKNTNKIYNNEIGILYNNDYIFTTNRSGNLLIIDNSNVREYLLKQLIRTICIFIILEAIIFFTTKEITKWIVKPVEDNFEKQKQFIYDASHELKTPIAIISASAETLEKSPKEKKWLDNIKNENDRMGKLVASLLDLSKSEEIREKENFEDVNLSKVIENKALTFESLIFENNLELVTNIEKEIIFNCNEDRIKELLSILMDNAIKHSYEKSNIVVSLYKEKKEIYLLVTNHGDPIPESEREKIFERFYRIDKARNRSENRYGLGLSIAKNIAINHNGNIKVDCKKGYTTFTVIFRES